MNDNKIPNAINQLINSIKNGEIEIYNEFSLQHELGIILRREFPDYLVQFERNASHFNGNIRMMTKKEIDICIYKKNPMELHSVIELKFPRNGQVPEQMFSFCKDIAFLEEMLDLGFRNAYSLIIVDDPDFYRGKRIDGIYAHFRNCVKIQGVIQKPTGSKDEKLTIKGVYSTEWIDICEMMKYTFFDISRSKNINTISN